MFRKLSKLHQQRPVASTQYEKNQCEDCDPNNKKKCSECSHAEYFEWEWDNDPDEPKAEFRDGGKHVFFNPGFSVGTVAVRGTTPLRKGVHHFFEIEMSTEVYGTDMMIGIGTEKTNLRRYNHNFVSFLGYDEESWGLSYNGDIQHNGFTKSYTTAFCQGDVIGVHVDLWAGTLEYYLNRKPLGIAFRNIKNRTLYPMVSSTAARSGMTLTYARSFEHTLQLQTLLHLGRQTYWHQNTSVFNCHELPPGLTRFFKTNFWWVTCHKEDKKDEICQHDTKQVTSRLRRKKAPSSSTDESDSDLGSNSETTENLKKDAGEVGSSSHPASGSVHSRTRQIPESKRLRLRSFNREN